MTRSTDERGRIFLPKAVRDRFGDRYRIVELPSHVALFPTDEDPTDGLRTAVDGAFDGEAARELNADARATVSDQVRDESQCRSRTDDA